MSPASDDERAGGARGDDAPAPRQPRWRAVLRGHAYARHLRSASVAQEVLRYTART